MLVTSATLARHLEDPGWIVFDCRHDLTDHGRGARLYAEGHLPGARFAPVETALSGPKTGRNGRHPLPDPAVFRAWLEGEGVSSDSTVVAYDDVGGLYAARLWWMARWIGVRNVSLLDGGLPLWIAEGRPITKALPGSKIGTIAANLSAGGIWNVDEVAARLARTDSVLVDARTPERFRGETEPIDPVAGRLPGAVNRPYKQNLNANLTFRPVPELRRELEALTDGRRAENVGHYCGSGVTACANLFAMDYVGLTGSALYPGSWSEWIADPARPVRRGA